MKNYNTLKTQIYYQLKRQFKIKLGESFNLVVSFVVAPLLAWLTALIFRSDTDLVANDSYPTFLFFMLISGVFFGLLSSVFEIIKDKAMIQRESLGGVSGVGYYLSKYLVLAFFGLIQTILFNIVAMELLALTFGLMFFNSIIMYLLVLISISLGLFVSSIVRSTLVASNLIPIFIIPQILLGGLIPYNQMDQSIFMWEENIEAVPPMAKAIPVKYAYESVVMGNIAFINEEEGEINNQISQMVNHLEYNQFMSIEQEAMTICFGLEVCEKTWFFNILIMLLYNALMLLLGYFTFKRRIYNG